jgi:hypothetical protein
MLTSLQTQPLGDDSNQGAQSEGDTDNDDQGSSHQTFTESHEIGDIQSLPSKKRRLRDDLYAGLATPADQEGIGLSTQTRSPFRTNPAPMSRSTLQDHSTTSRTRRRRGCNRCRLQKVKVSLFRSVSLPLQLIQ